MTESNTKEPEKTLSVQEQIAANERARRAVEAGERLEIPEEKPKEPVSYAEKLPTVVTSEHDKKSAGEKFFLKVKNSLKEKMAKLKLKRVARKVGARANVNYVGVRPRKITKNPVFWVGVIGGSVVVIAVVVAVVVINIRRAQDEPWTQEHIQEVQTNYREMIEEKLPEMVTVEDTMKMFWELLDGVEGEERVIILSERLRYLLNLDEETVKNYSGQVVADAVEIDDILQSVESAGQVLNIGYMFEDNDLIEKYAAIMVERQKAEGVDLNEEVRG